jgi:hypothetical protein
MKVIGIKVSNFKTADGTTVEGFNIYMTYPLSGEGVAGEGCERIYITKSKIEKCDYMPQVGDDVEVSYNRFGKVSMLLPSLR